MSYQGRPAPGIPLLPTDRQMPFIRDLLLKHEIPPEPRAGHDEDALMLERVMDVLGKKQIWRHEASELIDWLRVLPLKPGAKRAPQARRMTPRPGDHRYARSRWTPNAPARTGRSDKDVATEAIAVARQLAAMPTARRRTQLVEELNALEQELK